MGTRHLICVVSDEEFKVTQYGQFDGDPENQGADIARFIHQHFRTDAWETFVKNVNACSYLTAETYQQCWVDAGANPGEPADAKTMDRFKVLFPQLARETGAKILSLILEEPQQLEDSLGFAGDGLFCMWSYVIDLDNSRLEVYAGLKDVEPQGRFASFESVHENYGPVTLVCASSFDELPDDFGEWVQRNLAAL